MLWDNDIDHMFMKHLKYNSLLNENTSNTNYKQLMEYFGKLYEDWYYNVLLHRLSACVVRARRLYEFLNTVDIDQFSYLMYQCPSYEYTDMHNNDIDVIMYFSRKDLILDDLIHLKYKFPSWMETSITKIAESCGYTESYRFIDNPKSSVIGIAFRPNYTTEVTDFVYNQCNGILWHVCPKSVWEKKILKTGLIPKFGNRHKRVYAPRICFYTAVPSHIERYIDDLKAGKRNSLNSTLYNKLVDEPYVLLKIDLNKETRQTYHFYEDTEYAITNAAVYTYNTINPKCIEFIKEVE